MTEDERGEIRELVGRALADNRRSADPEAVVRTVLRRLTVGQRETLIEVGLREIVALEIRMARHGDAPPVAGPSRWRAVMPPRVIVAGQWKFLAECHLADLHWLAADYQARSDQMLAKRDEVLALAHELEVSGYATVGALWAAREAA